jgi:hypothetical protein
VPDSENVLAIEENSVRHYGLHEDTYTKAASKDRVRRTELKAWAWVMRQLRFLLPRMKNPF